MANYYRKLSKQYPIAAASIIAAGLTEEDVEEIVSGFALIMTKKQLDETLKAAIQLSMEEERLASKLNENLQ